MTAPDFAELWATADGAAEAERHEWPEIWLMLLDNDRLRTGVTGRPSRAIGLADIGGLSWGREADWHVIETEHPTESTRRLTAEILARRERKGCTIG